MSAIFILGTNWQQRIAPRHTNHGDWHIGTARTFTYSQGEYMGTDLFTFTFSKPCMSIITNTFNICMYFTCKWRYLCSIYSSYFFVKFDIWYLWYLIIFRKDCKVPDDGESSPNRVGWQTSNIQIDLMWFWPCIFVNMWK